MNILYYYHDVCGLGDFYLLFPVFDALRLKHKDDKIDVEVHYFLCETLNKNIVLSEHEDMKWVQKNDLLKFKMAPGDSKIIKYLD